MTPEPAPPEEADGADSARQAAQLATARADWPGALKALVRLRRIGGEQPEIAHEIALVLLRMGDATACRDQLAPWLLPDAPVADAALVAAMQCLWLRASHRLGLLRQARDWAAARRSERRLTPAAAGVASLVSLDLGEFARARSLAKTALADHPVVPEALVARASLALLQRESAAAVRWLTRALQVEPENGRTWATMALANLQGDEPALARAQFSHAARLLPSHVRVWQGLGWSCLLLEDGAGALAAFRQGLALEPEQAEGNACVGLVLQLTGRDAEAEQHLARAEQIDPDSATTRHARALARGQPQDRLVVRALAGRLLQPPGFHGAQVGG